MGIVKDAITTFGVRINHESHEKHLAFTMRLVGDIVSHVAYVQCVVLLAWVAEIVFFFKFCCCCCWHTYSPLV